MLITKMVIEIVSKEVGVMPLKDGTGPGGKGPMTGLSGGRCIIPLNTTKEELTYLENQEKVLREQLAQIEIRIAVLKAHNQQERKHANRSNSVKSKSGV
jgi:hypothetical protein